MTHLSIPCFWRMNKAKYNLVGVRCRNCGKVAFPPRRVCLKCGCDTLDCKTLGDSGQILTWSTIHVGPSGFETPYTVCLVRLNGAIGDSVEVVYGDVDKGVKISGVGQSGCGETDCDDGVCVDGEQEPHGGPVVTGQLVGDLSHLEIGAQVRVVFRRINENKDGLLLYGFKFELV